MTPGSTAFSIIKTALAPEFIVEVSPKIAVIQANKGNPYNHPHSETLEALNKYDIKILRTDLDRDLKIICNSQSLKLK